MKILALIRTKDLTDIDEAIEARSHCFGKMRGKLSLPDWEESETESFQTSKSLTDLKNKFEAQGMAVYLHEGEHKTYRLEAKAQNGYMPCHYCSSSFGRGGAYFYLSQDKQRKFKYCERCKEQIRGSSEKKPLMLAVFGDEDKVKGLV